MRYVKELLYKLADEVEKKVKEITGQGDLGKDLGMGADGTPTKLVDDVAEKTCIQVLKEENAELNLLSEE